MAVEPFLRTRPQQGFIGTSEWLFDPSRNAMLM